MSIPVGMFVILRHHGVLCTLFGYWPSSFSNHYAVLCLCYYFRQFSTFTYIFTYRYQLTFVVLLYNYARQFVSSLKKTSQREIWAFLSTFIFHRITIFHAMSLALEHYNYPSQDRETLKFLIRACSLPLPAESVNLNSRGMVCSIPKFWLFSF